MSSWLKEPLLHFLGAGCFLFAAYAWLNRGGGGAPRVVRITTAVVNWLKETWTRQWQPPPGGARSLKEYFVFQGWTPSE